MRNVSGSAVITATGMSSIIRISRVCLLAQTRFVLRVDGAQDAR